MLETEYSGFGVITTPADALDPKVARASAGMVLAVYDRQHVLLFQNLISSTWVNPNPRYDSKCEYIFYNL